MQNLKRSINIPVSNLSLLRGKKTDVNKYVIVRVASVRRTEKG